MTLTLTLGVVGTLNLGVAYDGADLSERLCAGPLHLEVRVSQHVDEPRHDARQARRQLAWRTVRHRAQQLHRPSLGAPRVAVEPG